MDEADSATKALGLDEPPIEMPSVEGSDTESEAEVATMAVMAEPGNIDMGAEALPNPDEAEAEAEAQAAFAGKQGRAGAEQQAAAAAAGAAGAAASGVLSGGGTPNESP